MLPCAIPSCMTRSFQNVQMTGPPMKLVWEKRGGKEKYVIAPESQKVLWECSEASTGITFLS